MTDEEMQEMEEAVTAITKTFRKLGDAIVRAFNNFCEAICTLLDSVDWTALYEALCGLEKHRPQRRPDPVSRARLLSARRRLPNTVVIPWR